MALQAPPRDLVQSAFQPVIRAFIERVILLLGHQAAVPTSWYRSVDANIAVGGDPESQHLFAIALDLAVPRSAVAHVLETAQGLGLIAVDERTHVHLQLFPAGALARAGVVFPS